MRRRRKRRKSRRKGRGGKAKEGSETGRKEEMIARRGHGATLLNVVARSSMPSCR